MYCDPPCAGTEPYTKTCAPFDHDAFWRTMRVWAERGAHVFVSEYTAPADWQPVWTAPRGTGTGLRFNDGTPRPIDQLVTYQP